MISFLRSVQRTSLTIAAMFFTSHVMTPALAQEQAEAEAGPISEPSGSDMADATATPHKKKLIEKLKDDEDGKLDFSEFLAGGGFFPMPVIITEPAVDGGFGLVAQFVSVSNDDPTRMTRRMLGAVKTGNGSYGYGYFQSGSALDGRLSYKFGLGRGKITLTSYPDILPEGLEYTNKYKYGIMGTALWRFPDKRFSVGPIIDFRKLSPRIDFRPDDEEGNLPGNLQPDFDRTLKTGALGLGFHFDSRDNPITPTQGVNAFIEGKFNSGTFGSDRTFQIYDADVYAFHRLSPDWRLGVKVEVDAARQNFPLYFAPAIDLRGVQAQRFQGSTVISSELEVTRQLNDRWALIGFAGIGATDAGERRLFDNSGAVFAGGGGFRYRIARKLGLDAGIDAAYGPDGAVFYLQFGHAWSIGMD